MGPKTLHLRRFSNHRKAFVAWVCLCFIAWFSQPAYSQSQLSWNFVGPTAPPSRVLALAIDPRNDSVIYLAAPGGGIWKTENGGGYWFPQFDSAPSLQVCSVALDPRSPEVVYVGTGDDQNPRPAQGVARSSDAGRSWTFGARFTNRPVCALAVDPADSRRIFAGSLEGLFLSSDAGGSWNKVLSTPVTSVASDGAGNIYAGILGAQHAEARDNVLARSSDGGRSWTNLILPPNPTTIGPQSNWVNVVASANAVSLVVSYHVTPIAEGYASSTQAPLSQLDFYRSTDGGNTWYTTFRMGQARPPVALASDAGARTLYVAGSSLMISVNDGIGWQTIPTTTGEFHTAVFAGSGLLLGGERGLESTARTVPQLPIGQFVRVSLDSANGIWAAGPAGLFAIFPGSRYAETGVPGIGAVGGVGAAAIGTTNIFAAGNSRVHVSTDGGARFTSRTVLPDGELRAPFPPFLLDSANSAAAYVAGQRVYRTNNSGATWTASSIVDSDPTRVVIALAAAPAFRAVLYAATACLPEVALVSCPATSFIWRSTNSGDSWVLASVVAGFVNRLAIDPRQTNTVYAALGAFPAGPSISAGYAASDVLQSVNNGVTWNSIRGNLPDSPVNAIVIDPSSLPAMFTQLAQRIYVGTDAGVFVTFNAQNCTITCGVQWTDITSLIRSLPPSPITDLVLQPGGTLIAATFGRGIYSTSTLGLASTAVVNPLSLKVTLMQGTSVTTGVPLTNVSRSSSMGWRLNALDPWLSVLQPTGTVTPLSSTQIPIRISADGLEAGIYLGRLRLVAGGFAQNISVEAHVGASPAHITIISGNNATGSAGTSLPLQVLISDARDVPIPGATVTFAIATGGGSLSARTAPTNASGIASTTLRLPPNPGSVQVVASIQNLSAAISLTAIAAPTLFADAVFDGVTLNAYTPLGPGSILSIFGQNLATGIAIAGGSSLPTLLQTTRVLLSTGSSEVALPLLSVSPIQLRALLPFDISPGIYLVHIEVGGGSSNDIQISIAAFSPGIFTMNGSGRGPGIFVKDDGSLVTAANPADRGSTITFYAAGLGAVNPAGEAGQPGSVREPLNRTIRTPRVAFDTYQAQVIYSGLVPGAAGRYQVTVRVPALLSPATNISVSLTIGGFASNRVTIPVR